MTAQTARGVVYLVGAGPGDPELITVRGRRLLEQAEVVVYDYLSNPQLLRYCPQAQVSYVGKKAADHTMSQEEINQLLVEQGSAGKRVVRLKGGDPFIFGRGGEECEALRAAGVRFEVVPGITASIGGSAYAGIPVTHRNLNSSFTVITGHEKEEAYRDPQSLNRAPAAASDLDWSALAKLPCMAFYMGVKALPRICARLIEHGMEPAMPAATIQWGTHPRQRTVVATIADLPQRVADAGIGSPAITIVGRVVQMRETMNWFETRPLFGQTIVVTRTRQQASDLSQRLADLGANVIEAPTIDLAPADPAAPRKAMRDLAGGGYDWMILTSANGVSAVKQLLMDESMDARSLSRVRVAAVGEATAAALREQLGIRADLVPTRAVAESLLESLAEQGQIKGNRFVLFRADIGRALLIERLRAEGAARIDDVAIYQTRPVTALPDGMLESLDAAQVQWITFTSSSTVSNFLSLLGSAGARRLRAVKLASIGPITSATLRENGLEPTVQAEEFNIEGLVEAISAHSAADRGKA